jgi:hypothetical protein
MEALERDLLQQQEISTINNDINNQEPQMNKQDSQQRPNTSRPLLQQTIPQYDQTPYKRNESWGASINNLPPTTFRIYFLRQHLGYISKI